MSSIRQSRGPQWNDSHKDRQTPRRTAETFIGQPRNSQPIMNSNDPSRRVCKTIARNIWVFPDPNEKPPPMKENGERNYSQYAIPLERPEGRVNYTVSQTNVLYVAG